MAQTSLYLRRHSVLPSCFHPVAAVSLRLHCYVLFKIFFFTIYYLPSICVLFDESDCLIIGYFFCFLSHKVGKRRKQEKKSTLRSCRIWEEKKHARTHIVNKYWNIVYCLSLTNEFLYLGWFCVSHPDWGPGSWSRFRLQIHPRWPAFCLHRLTWPSAHLWLRQFQAVREGKDKSCMHI